MNELTPHPRGGRSPGSQGAAGVSLLLLLLAAAGPVPGQAPPPSPSPEVPAFSGAAAAAPAPKVPPAVAEAVRKVSAGDVAGALALLEPLRDRPDTPLPALSLLGAVYVEAGRPQEALAVLAPLAGAAQPDPAVLFHAGRAALALGREEEGEAYLSRSVVRAPASEASRLLGLRRASQGRTLEAYKLLRWWLEATPEDQGATLVAAFCAVDLERVDEAAILLERLPADTPRVRVLKGQLRLLQSDARAALAELEPLEAAHPPELDGDLRRALAEARIRVGRPAEALRALQAPGQGATTPPTDPRATWLLARALRETGKPADCQARVAPLVQALRRGELPERAAVRVGLLEEQGRCAAALGQHERAVEALRAALALAPGDIALWEALGQSYRALARAPEAEGTERTIQRLREAAQSAPPSPAAGTSGSPAIARGLELFRRGEVERGIEALRVEADLAIPADAPARMALTWALIQSGRPVQAEAEASALVARHAGSADGLHLRGAARLAQNKKAEAEGDFRAALAAKSDHLPALSDLGVLLMGTDRAAEAVRLFERALALRPADPRLEAHLAEARRLAKG